jgi:hypothetical protein
MKQDKITIHGPKTDGTYIVEFKTTAWRSHSQCQKGAGPSWSTSKTRCPMGSRCRMSHGVFHRAFTGLSPEVGAIPSNVTLVR